MNTRQLIAVVTALACAAHVALAGPITPPPGPVASTHKTLSEVEPRIPLNSTNTPGDFDSVFRITTPGSYYLTGNVTGGSGRMGIKVVAAHVTIDLNGFTLVGASGSLAGIAISGGVETITVRNGTVIGWGGHGLDLYEAGLLRSARVDSVVSRLNGGVGFSLGQNATVLNCIADSNTGSGFEFLFNGVLEGSVARQNTGYGVTSGNSAVIRSSSIRENVAGGVLLGTACLISDCSVFNNSNDGITTGFASKVENCVVVSNVGDGISMLEAGFVRSCTVVANTENGIAARGADCTITDNNCDSNGATLPNAGILIGAADCVVAGNNVTDNAVGIRATVAGSFIARNVCSGNTLNWDVVANNKCLVVNGVNAGAINGNSGGVSPGSTDPNANYTY